MGNRLTAVVLSLSLAACTLHGGVREPAPSAAGGATSPEGSARPVPKPYSTDEATLYMGVHAAIVAGDMPAAEQLARQLVDRRPDFSDAQLDYINILIFRKDIDGASIALDNALKSSPDDPDLLFVRANMLLYKGRKQDAEALLTRLVRANPDRESFVLTLSNLYIDTKKHDKARTLLEELLQRSPRNYAGHMLMAKAYELGGDNAKAAEYYSKAFSFRDEDDVLMDLDRVFEKLGDRARSIEVLDQFLQRNPDYPKVRERLALLYFGIDEYRKAYDQFARLVEQFPENAELRYKALLVATELNDLDAMKTHIDAIERLQPGNSRLPYYQGLYWRARKDCGKAVPYFLKVTEDDMVRPAKIGAAVCYEKTGDGARAYELLNELWNAGKDADVGYFLALNLSRQKRHADGLAVLGKLQADAADRRVLFLKAEMLMKSGSWQAGIDIVKAVLDKNPDDVEALNFIGYSYAERGVNLGEAERMIARALEKKPGDPFITDSLAWVHYAAGRYEKAYELQLKALEKVGDEGTLLEHMGDILLALGRRAEALDHYRKALVHEPENPEALKKKIDGLSP